MPQDSLLELSGDIECEGPNEYLESWAGFFNLNNDSHGHPLKGSVLRNTQWIIGVSVYCGHQTKIFKNARNPPSKISHVIKTMNKILYTVFAFQSMLCFFFALGGIIWEIVNQNKLAFFGIPIAIGFGDFIVRIFVFLISYSQLIPISLYVALEVLKLILSYFISLDNNMNYKPINKKAKVKTSDLVEELGQINFLFSDKTGTLTCNEMIFRKCLIGNMVYGTSKDCTPRELKYHLNGDASLYEEIINERANAEKISEFFRLVSLCHTVVPDLNDKDSSTFIKYQASSPDELALVEGAKSMGFMLTNRTMSTIEIKIFNRVVEEWNILLEFPFDSTRKRMSVIVKSSNSQNYLLLTKGADSAMLPKLNVSPDDLANLKDQLEIFAKEGLRTLVMGKRIITKKDYEQIEKEVLKIQKENHRNKDKYLSNIFDFVENKLDYLGCSAIEDRLQAEVPQTISLCLEAGIKVWVLTGDKQETAIEIGKSCHLIKEEMNLVILSSIDKEDFKNKLNMAYEKYSYKKLSVSKKRNSKNIVQTQDLAIVIDGSTLLFAFDRTDPITLRKFFNLALKASSCICCRVSPKQKADVVSLAKSRGNFITAAIGDGANDVSMIMEAHIGIGIFGKEGTQAARSADFAIAQFRFLQNLLFVHGRWNYRRISNFICYYFYKNCTLVFPSVFFAVINGFSGQIFFLDWLPLLFNAFWTSWPCMANFALEQVLVLIKDINAIYSLKIPSLYKLGNNSQLFNVKIFWKWIFFSLTHGICCFWIPIIVKFLTQALQGIIYSDGNTSYHWVNSTVSFSLMMNVITLKLFLETLFYCKFNLYHNFNKHFRNF